MPDIQQKEQTGVGVGTSILLDFDAPSDRDLEIYVDNTAGGQPASYDLEVETREDSQSDWMTHATETDSTAYHNHYDVPSGKVRVTLTNQSGASADYRIRNVY